MTYQVSDAVSATNNDLSTEDDVAPARLSLRERQQRRTHQDLVQATLDVISELGLRHATIQRITSRAGTSRATLYAHFPEGRDQVYAHAYRTLGNRLIHRAEQLAAEQPDWVSRLCAYVQAMVELASHQKLGLFYNVSGPRLAGMKYRGSGSQRTLDVFVDELRTAKSSNEISPDLDIESIAALLVGCIREAGIDTSRDPEVATQRLAAFRQLLEALKTAT